METYVKLLQTYTGREKIMRTAGYVAMLLSGAADGQAAKKLGTVSSQISAARVILRLFDDLPMLCYVAKYGTGSQVLCLFSSFLAMAKLGWKMSPVRVSQG